MNKFIFNIGDEARDGHGRYEEFTVKSDLDYNDIYKLYSEGVKEKFDIDITTMASEYLDTEIPSNIWLKLLELGFDENTCGIEVEENIVNGEDKSYADVWDVETYLDIVIFLMNKAYGEDVVFKVKEDHTWSIDIGGYGLFG